MLRGVETGGGGLCNHGAGWRIQGNEQANSRFLPFHIAFQGGDMAPVDAAALYLDDDALGQTAVVVEKVYVAVHAGVCSLFPVLGRAGIYQP